LFLHRRGQRRAVGLIPSKLKIEDPVQPGSVHNKPVRHD
jgi:hypothetical protein